MHHPRTWLGICDEGNIACLSWTDGQGDHQLSVGGRNGLTVDGHHHKPVAVQVHRMKFSTADIDLPDAHVLSAANHKRFGERITLAVDAKVVFCVRDDAPG